MFLSQHSPVIIFTVKSSFHPAEILPANCKTKIRDQQQTQIRASIAWNINYIFFLPFNVPLRIFFAPPLKFSMLQILYFSFSQRCYWLTLIANDCHLSFQSLFFFTLRWSWYEEGSSFFFLFLIFLFSASLILYLISLWRILRAPRYWNIKISLLRMNYPES